MQLTIQGKQIELGQALRNHVEERIEDINEKYFNHATYATVTFSREGHGHGLVKTHISIRVGKNIMVMADAVEGDPYLSFDEASAKVAEQLRRYKNRLRDHHERLEAVPEAATMKARDYVLAREEHHDEEHGELKGVAAPAIIAEMATAIQTMSVSEAVMRLDLAGLPALLFRNGSHNGLNMVYRRPDGNIGWVDPEGNNKAASAKTKKPVTAKAPAKAATKTSRAKTAKRA